MLLCLSRRSSQLNLADRGFAEMRTRQGWAAPGGRAGSYQVTSSAGYGDPEQWQIGSRPARGAAAVMRARPLRKWPQVRQAAALARGGGQALPGHEASKARRGARGGRQIDSRPARGAAADMGPGRPGSCGSGAVAEVAVDLAGDIPLQAADDLPLRQAFLGAPLDVGAGSRVGPHPGDHDPPQRLVGFAVAAAVEPVQATLPEEAGIGATPHRCAPSSRCAAAPGDPRRRPAAARRYPGRHRAGEQAGARAVTSGPISSSRRSSWASRNCTRRPSSRSATRVA